MEEAQQCSHNRPPRSALTADSTESTHTSIKKPSAILTVYTVRQTDRRGKKYIQCEVVSQEVHNRVANNFNFHNNYLSNLPLIDSWDLISRLEVI